MIIKENMLYEFSSVWAILTRLTDLVLWIIGQLTASVNSINDHETRLELLEGAENGGGSGEGGSGTAIITVSNTQEVVTSGGILFIDASEGPVHVTLTPATPTPPGITPLVQIVSVSAANANSIIAPIRDAVGNPLISISFLNDGQSVTLIWYAPRSRWFVVGATFSGQIDES